MTGTLLSTRDTGTNEKEALGFQFLNTTDGIRVVRIATVDDDITLFEVRGQLTDEAIDRGPRFDEKYDLAGTLELGDKLFNGVSTLNFCAWVGVNMTEE